jgi:hypothetical protein
LNIFISAVPYIFIPAVLYISTERNKHSSLAPNTNSRSN